MYQGACACSFWRTQLYGFSDIAQSDPMQLSHKTRVFQPDKQLAGNQILWGHWGPLTQLRTTHIPGNRLYHSGRCIFEGVFQVVLQVTEESPCTSFHHVKETAPIAGLHVWRRGTCQRKRKRRWWHWLHRKPTPLGSQIIPEHLGQTFLEVTSRAQNWVTLGYPGAVCSQSPKQVPPSVPGTETSRTECPELQPRVICAHWALEMWLLRTEMGCEYSIHTKFQRQSPQKKEHKVAHNILTLIYMLKWQPFGSTELNRLCS